MVIPPRFPSSYSPCSQSSLVGTMFMAGIIPGLLMGLTFAIAALFYLRNDKNIIRREKSTWKGIWTTFRKAFWGLLTPVIILGGIYGGIFTPTEAAGVAVVYGLFVGIFVYREIKVTALFRIFVDASVSSAIIMFIMGCAGAFTWILTTSAVAAKLSAALLSVSANNTVMMLIIMVIFMIAGCFVDSASGFYLLLPIILPIVKKTGYPMYAFGVLATVNFAIGQITPPVGSNLFVACNIADVTMRDLVSKVWPFLIAGIVCLLLMTFFPQIITCLPSLLGLS